MTVTNDAFDFTGRSDRSEGVCQEADQAEPTRQHQQQGEEEE